MKKRDGAKKRRINRDLEKIREADTEFGLLEFSITDENGKLVELGDGLDDRRRELAERRLKEGLS